MRKIRTDPLAIKVGNMPGLLEMFIGSTEKLESIHRSLEAYLDMKRLDFPRFNFLSDDDLVDVLSKSKSPHMLQAHIWKMFKGVESLQIEEEEDLEVTAIVSPQGDLHVNNY